MPLGRVTTGSAGACPAPAPGDLVLATTLGTQPMSMPCPQITDGYCGRGLGSLRAGRDIVRAEQGMAPHGAACHPWLGAWLPFWCRWGAQTRWVARVQSGVYRAEFWVAKQTAWNEI